MQGMIRRMSRLRSAFEREASARSHIHFVSPGLILAIALFYAAGLRIPPPYCVAVLVASLVALYAANKAPPLARCALRAMLALACTLAAVSYTHLTLPTIYSV